MSLHPKPFVDIPAETVRIAKAAHPKGTLAMRVRDQLGGIFQDADFAALYPRRGQSGAAPWQLALVTLLQFVEDLTDRQAADAVRSRIDWKYALGLELSDAGFDASILSEFRSRLVEHGAEECLLEGLLQVCEQHGWLKAGGRQRTDSTHVVAAIRALSDLEVVGETLRAALEDLAQREPGWLRRLVEPHWAERYGRRIENYRLPKEPPKRQALAEAIGADGWRILEALAQAETPSTLLSLPSVQVLQAVWEQSYEREGTQLKWKGGSHIRSPYDPEARTGKKRSTQWQGYKVHLTETCEPEHVELITQVTTTPANVTDVEKTDEIQQALQQHNRAPREQLVDAGYTDAQLLLSSRVRNIELVGPVAGESSWQQREGKGFGQQGFQIDWQQQQVTCPHGQRNATWEPEHDATGGTLIKVTFAATECQVCPLHEQCTHSKRTGRTLTLRDQQRHEALQQRRTEQVTPEFQQRYGRRAGIEATLSQGVRVIGMRSARYLGHAKTHLQHVATAAAINLLRLDAMLTETPRAPTRHSHLSRFLRQVA